MNLATDSSAASVRSRAASPWLWAWAFLGVSLAAITSQSFWIDEFATDSFATQQTLRDWGHLMRTTIAAEAQLPLYLFYMWVWEKGAGHGEWATRIAAVPWFLPGAVAFVMAVGARVRTHVAVGLVVGLSPFLWYYLDEARLYAAQMGIACWIVAALCRLAPPTRLSGAQERRWLHALVAGVVALCGFSMLGMIWASAACGAALVLMPRAQWHRWWRDHRGLWLGVGLVLGVLAAYYLWTVLRGARATQVGEMQWQNVVFVVYEQLGFTGLGPGRLALRERGAGALSPHLSLLVPYACVAAGVIGSGGWQTMRESQRRRAIGLLGCLAGPSAFLIGAGFAMHFRVLGRHYAPLMPVWWLVGSLGLAWLWRRPGAWGKSVALAYLVLSLGSVLSVRFAPRHQKDDYRGATQLAMASLAKGESVWWVAEPAALPYYGVTGPGPDQIRAGLLVVPGRPKDSVKDLPPPDVVVYSKPDVYDPYRDVGTFLGRGGYRAVSNLTAFTVWRQAPR